MAQINLIPDNISTVWQNLLRSDVLLWRDISTAQPVIPTSESTRTSGNLILSQLSYQIYHFLVSREFLELDAELPKASQTSTLSGKSVLKAITKLGDKVSQYATKMEETDSWFEDKTNIIENLDIQLRKLLLATDAMVEFRFEIFLPGTPPL